MGIPEELARALARVTFGPFPGQVDDALARSLSVEDVIEERAAIRAPFEPRDLAVMPRGDGVELVDSGPLRIDGPDPAPYDNPHSYRNWWVQRLMSDDAGLHDRMMWTWHGILTTGAQKIDRINLIWQQLRILNRHALGNLRDLLVEMSVSGATLLYLDGVNSDIKGPPNENYARELMELFTLGRGRFTQTDVVAVAKVLAGWSIDVEHEPLPDNRVWLRTDAALDRPVTVLGVRGVRRVGDLVDVLLRHEACAPFVVGRLWDALIGGPRNRRLVDRWARSFRKSGYEIGPLVRTMVHSRQFLEIDRPRSGLEWYCSVLRIWGLERRRDIPVDLERLGQSPYLPPNVAGWPNRQAWLSSTHLAARIRLIADLRLPADVAAAISASNESPVQAALARCSLPSVDAATTAALADLDRKLSSVTDESHIESLLRVIALTPEFASP